MDDKFRFRDENEMDLALAIIRFWDGYIAWRTQGTHERPIAMQPTLPEFITWLAAQVEESTIS